MFPLDLAQIQHKRIKGYFAALENDPKALAEKYNEVFRNMIRVSTPDGLSRLERVAQADKEGPYSIVVLIEQLIADVKKHVIKKGQSSNVELGLQEAAAAQIGDISDPSPLLEREIRQMSSGELRELLAHPPDNVSFLQVGYWIAKARWEKSPQSASPSHDFSKVQEPQAQTFLSFLIEKFQSSPTENEVQDLRRKVLELSSRDFIDLGLSILELEVSDDSEAFKKVRALVREIEILLDF